MKFNKEDLNNSLKPFVIAEIGANHNGDMQLCERLITAAKASGADAVKFQSWSDKTLIAESAYKHAESSGFDLRGAIQKYQLTPNQHKEAAKICESNGIVFVSTAFSLSEVDMLEELNVPFHKVASMDVTHHYLLRKFAGTGKPVILSTGMASLGEIEAALTVLEHEGANDITLLHCVSIYPPQDDMVNLNNIETLKSAFGYPVGFSDHTIGTAIPLAAIALGATVIEKHFTLDKTLEGWDHAVSATPNELAEIVKGGQRIRSALGTRRRTLSVHEIKQRESFRRSVVVNKELESGTTLSIDDLDFKRPGTGISPDRYLELIGKKLNQKLSYDQLLSYNDLTI